ncbi:hypothetical protein GQR58_028308 [Nymphon striatum]|nr:hypothetical protein GQR58_028308 [Nymphon striatum]
MVTTAGWAPLYVLTLLFGVAITEAGRTFLHRNELFQPATGPSNQHSPKAVQCKSEIQSELNDYGGCTKAAHQTSIIKVSKCISKLFGFSFYLSNFKKKAADICKKTDNIFECVNTMSELSCWTETERKKWTTGLKAFKDGFNYLCAKDRKHIKG